MNSDGWTDVRLGDACTKIGSGATPRGGGEVYVTDGKFALIRSQNVYNDGFHHDGLAHIGEEHASELDNVEVLKGDVLLNITGDSVARCCQVDDHVLPARVNQHVAIVRPDPQKLDARFLRYFLLSPLMQAKMLSWAGAGGTRNALTKGMIESFEVSAPKNVKEQAAIGVILGTLDDKIVLNQKIIETLESMARTLFRSWFVDFDPVRAKAEKRETHLPRAIADKFPNSFQNSQDTPEGWHLVPLPDAIEVNPPRHLRRGDIAPYLDMANMPTRGHSPDSVVKRAFGSGMRFTNGDTLVARITPCLENGKTAYVDFLKQGEVGWGSTEFIVLHPKEPLPPEYGYCLARSHLFREFAIQSMTGSSGRQRVPSEGLSHFQVVVPPEPVAIEFGKYASSLIARAHAAMEQSRTLAALRSTLLPTLISGELRVPDAERIVGGQM